MSRKFLSIPQDLLNQVKNLSLPNPLGFGQHVAPIVANAYFQNGEWNEAKIEALKPLTLLPNTKIFHYGQQIFEGMKAYRHNNGAPRLFRLDESFQRFNQSAKRMAMPQIGEDTFCRAIESLVYYLRDFIPQGYGESLYLRPVMIATDTGLSLSTSTSYHFYVLASPSGAYFSADRVVALLERDDCRAAPGGTGAVKTSGNYGGSIQSAIKARELGFQQTLWLDPRHAKYIEEFSGMNFFAVINNEVFTPALKNTILPGITRKSIIELARSKGFKVHEVDMDIDELICDIKAGKCSEVFACGTAAVITPVAALGEKTGEIYEIKESFGPVSKNLRESLLRIQYGLDADPFKWTHDLLSQETIKLTAVESKL